MVLRIKHLLSVPALATQGFNKKTCGYFLYVGSLLPRMKGSIAREGVIRERGQLMPGSGREDPGAGSVQTVTEVCQALTGSPGETDVAEGDTTKGVETHKHAVCFQVSTWL